MNRTSMHMLFLVFAITFSSAFVLSAYGSEDESGDDDDDTTTDDDDDTNADEKTCTAPWLEKKMVAMVLRLHIVKSRHLLKTGIVLPGARTLTVTESRIKLAVHIHDDNGHRLTGQRDNDCDGNPDMCYSYIFDANGTFKSRQEDTDCDGTPDGECYLFAYSEDGLVLDIVPTESFLCTSSHIIS